MYSTDSLLAALEADLSASGIVICADDVKIAPAPKAPKIRVTSTVKAPKAPKAPASPKAPKAPASPKGIPGYPNGIATGKAYCTCCGYAKRVDRVTDGTCKTCAKALSAAFDGDFINVVGRVTKGNVPVVITWNGGEIGVIRVAVL